ncbi:Glycine oxidase [Zhongshania aliphaticivorans]|uniref:Glycine oxidase n=1 Tax=Zhongshania aliphaticivorans TaxID=1470434 RepID=A0A5S9MTN3_9GAMM|nr:glycine oxidase ThiO [Zhongshania aliphaticivorans]CAA0079602.1 Glycine oxidase [Zhongshania aliphaticivorans]CAA0086113.1 Glycine oxidase [Zhongshania aliphaticivorans]
MSSSLPNSQCVNTCKSTQAKTIGIAGAGLLGRLLAWKLLQQGYKVTLFDRGSRAAELSAAKVAASMLAPYSEVVSAERKVFDWGRMALSWWPKELAALAQMTGQHVDFATDGSIVIAHDLDKSSLTNFEHQLREKVPDCAEYIECIERDRLAVLEPELAERYCGGLFLAEEGYLDNEALLHSLVLGITALGGVWCEYTEVERVTAGRIHLATQQHCFDVAIDSRGMGAQAQLPALRGVRGEVLWVHAPEVSLQRPVRLMHPRYKLYISPRSGQRYVIGATEIESESMQPVTVRSSLELLSALYSVHSGFAEATVLHAYAHCRPAMPDNLPIIHSEPGLLRVNGLYRHGYLLSPYVVESALKKLIDCNDLATEINH